MYAAHIVSMRIMYADFRDVPLRFPQVELMIWAQRKRYQNKVTLTSTIGFTDWGDDSENNNNK